MAQLTSLTSLTLYDDAGLFHEHTYYDVKELPCLTGLHNLSLVGYCCLDLRVQHCNLQRLELTGGQVLVCNLESLSLLKILLIYEVDYSSYTFRTLVLPGSADNQLQQLYIKGPGIWADWPLEVYNLGLALQLTHCIWTMYLLKICERTDGLRVCHP